MRFILHQPRTLTIGLAAVGIVGLAAVIAVASDAARESHLLACSKVTSLTHTGPLAEGRKTTVTNAQSIAGYTVPTPDDPAASAANLMQTWANSQRQVALVYAGGKITITMAPAAYRNALHDFRKFMAQNHVTAAIGRVRGQPALVITRHTDRCGSNPAWVEFDQHGIDINLTSGNYATSTLLAVAESMKRRPA